jgi:hypothetical protein
MNFKIKDSGKTLCRSCTHSFVTTDERGTERTLCHYSGELISIKTRIVKCNQYESVNMLSEWKATQIGWVLEVKKGEVIGFKPPKRNEHE